MYDRLLVFVFCNIFGGLYLLVIEIFEWSKIIFFLGDFVECVYVLIKGVVKLFRVYEVGDEIIVVLFRENSVFGVLFLIIGYKLDCFYYVVVFILVELILVLID